MGGRAPETARQPPPPLLWPLLVLFLLLIACCSLWLAADNVDPGCLGLRDRRELGTQGYLQIDGR